MSKAKSGGGATSNKNVRVGIRTAPRTTNVINPAQTDYLGQATAFGKGQSVERTPREVVEMGNTKALDVGKGGCGTGRTIYARGYQNCYGATAPGEPKGRMESTADRGQRAILGPPKSKTV